ncbi:MAG: pilus assembly protein N-terminal domain-containing protein [Pirellulaceae bacterium]|nr:pilus assembly protein N-terminal domain-containing protein [Pirellulaceae bacterium]
MPRIPPRPAEGDVADQRWQLDRPQLPTAAFIDSLRGNDAALQVVVGQGRLLTLKADLARQDGAGFIAVGDPTVLDFEILPNPRMIRLIGRRIGVTDLSLTTADGETHSMEVQVGFDLTLIRARMLQVFPDAHLRFAQLHEHVVVEGQARNIAQVTQILELLTVYLRSAQVPVEVSSQEDNAPAAPPAQEELPPPATDEGGMPAPGEQPAPAETPSEAPQAGEAAGRPSTQATIVQPQIINLIRVPGSQQVLLKVRIAELNRTALREIGADILGVDSSTGNLIGTNISSATVDALGTLGLGGLAGLATGAASQNTTAFGIFPSGDWEIILRALRANAVATILAEPNLIAMSGHQAHFLAGGEFPISVPQTSGAGSTTTVEFREFGVRLNFLPFVLDENRIRLAVTPEVSEVDFTLGTTLVVGGDPVPGLNTRRASTTVELRQGQTLAIAGLLQVEIGGETERIPGLGDLPVLGPLFSNTRHRRVEKELLVLVSPYVVQPLEEHQVGPLPGHDVMDPTDGEFYFKNRIEGRTGLPFRATTDYEHFRKQQLRAGLADYLIGPHGYSVP